MPDPFPTGRRMFFVLDIGEQEEGSFRVVVTEAAAADLGTGIFLGMRTEQASIAVDPSRPSLELIWEDYVTYAVHAEHAFIPLNDAEPSSMLVEIQASAFLDYVRAATLAEGLGRTLRHWELSCLRHVIHVASDHPPRINALPPDGSFPLR